MRFDPKMHVIELSNNESSLFVSEVFFKAPICNNVDTAFKELRILTNALQKVTSQTE